MYSPQRSRPLQFYILHSTFNIPPQPLRTKATHELADTVQMQAILEPPVNPEPASKSSRRSWGGLTDEQTLVGLLVVGLFACGAMAVWQDDSFWQLRCGQAIWQAGSVPKTDILSFALPAATYWPNHEWLSQVLLYGLYQCGGFALASLAVGAVLAATGALLLGAMRCPMERRFAILLIALPWIVAALSVRPQVLTLLAMAATLLLLVRGVFWALPLVFLLWANMHGGVVLGGLLMCGWCAATLLFGDRRSLIRLAVATAACGLATLLTPMGLHIITFPIESVHRLKQLQLTEWLPPGFSGWQNWYFWAALAATLGILLLNWRRLHSPLQRKLALVTALFAVMACMSSRNVPNFLLVAAVAVSHALPMPETARTQAHRSRQNMLVLGVFCIGAIAGIAWAFRLPWSRLNWHPIGPPALAAMKACPQPIFNTYNTGGYLMWHLPERKVFCDSRQDPYPIELLRQLVTAQRTGKFSELQQQYHFRSAIMEPDWPLEQRLIEQGWQRTYRDRDWVVLVKPR